MIKKSLGEIDSYIPKELKILNHNIFQNDPQGDIAYWRS